MADDEKEDAASATISQAGHDELMDVLKQGKFKRPRARFSMLHLVVAVNTLILAAVIAGYMWGPWRPTEAPPAAEHPDVVLVPTSKSALQVSSANVPAAPVSPEASAVSCQSARLAMTQRRYPVALDQYEDLHQAALRAEDPVMADFFRLRQAQCQRYLGRRDVARTTLMGLQDSASPAVRAWACHDLAVIALSENQFLQSRTKAYSAVAALHLLKSPGALEADCDFIIGRAMTARAVTDADTLRWPESGLVKSLDAMDESALQAVLAEGSRKFAGALSAPLVQKVQTSSGETNWKVACLKAPLEEFLARLSTQSGIDIRFSGVSLATRARPVTMFEESMSFPRICEIAGGMAGLIARYDGIRLVLIDPQVVPSVQEQAALLRDEAIAHWRRVCLRYPGESRTAQANYTMAALLESGGDLGSALSQYLLTAGRFERDSVAPQALLQSARIRMALRDYVGARETMLNLLNTYPDIPEIESVYLTMGQSTMNAGMLEEASEVFSKLYYRELSPSSRIAACLGAGQCFHKMGKYDQACTWLGRYIKLAGAREDSEMILASLLLGQSQSAREKWTEASDAYYRCIKSGATGNYRFGAVVGFAQAQAKRGCYASALSMVRRLDREALASPQRTESILLEGRILRSMNLPEDAVEMLNREMNTVDKSDQLPLKRELTLAQMDGSMFDQAHRTYMDILPSLKAPDSYQATLELAQLCLAQDRFQQAQALCQDLLAGAAPDATKAKARELLARVFVKSQQYKQAVTTLGTPVVKGGPKK